MTPSVATVGPRVPARRPFQEHELTMLLARRAAAEFIGTALLLIAAVGSGIAAQSLSPNDTGLQLLENAAATGAALVAIILAVGPVSGAHLNPIVSCADALFGGLRPRELATYCTAREATRMETGDSTPHAKALGIEAR